MAKKKLPKEELAEFKNGKYMGGPAEERAEKKGKKKTFGRRFNEGGYAGPTDNFGRRQMDGGDMQRQQMPAQAQGTPAIPPRNPPTLGLPPAKPVKPPMGGRPGMLGRPGAFNEGRPGMDRPMGRPMPNKNPNMNPGAQPDVSPVSNGLGNGGTPPGIAKKLGGMPANIPAGLGGMQDMQQAGAAQQALGTAKAGYDLNLASQKAALAGQQGLPYAQPTTAPSRPDPSAGDYMSMDNNPIRTMPNGQKVYRKGGVVKKSAPAKRYAKGGLVKGSGCASRGVKKPRYC